MDKEKQEIIIMCILAAALLSILITPYYGAVIKPGLDERDSKISGFEPKAEIWTPELREIYADSHPLEYLKYDSPKLLAINNESMEVEYIIIVTIPESMESRALFVTDIGVKTWEDDSILIGNKTKTSKVESELAYIFTNVNVSNNLQKHCRLFARIVIIEINLTSATFPADSTHGELEFHDEGGVLNVTFQENVTHRELQYNVEVE